VILTSLRNGVADVFATDHYPNSQLRPRARPGPNRGERGGRGNDGYSNSWQGGYRLGGGLGRYGNRYRDLPEYVRRLNLNRELQGGHQRPDLWQSGETPTPRQPVPRPDTPEPNNQTLPQPPSRPMTPRPSTPHPRPNPRGGEDGDDCFTLWVIRLDTDQHRCVDEELFRQPFSPDPIIMEDDSMLQPQGTVVIPIQPRSRYNMGTSVMTISNTLYTPTARHSELSMPVLQKQGFRLGEIRHADRALLRTLPRGFGSSRLYVLQHDNLPGIDILYAACLDGDRNCLSTGEARVNKRKWIEGVQSGILGRAVDMDGTLGWTEASEHSKFEDLVLDPEHRSAGIDRIPGDEDITTVLH